MQLSVQRRCKAEVSDGRGSRRDMQRNIDRRRSSQQAIATLVFLFCGKTLWN